MSNVEMIIANNLVLADNNSRKAVVEKHQDDELKASIEQNGLLQNLVVGKANDIGQHPVYAGGRRLGAIMALIDEGKLELDIKLPCRVVYDEGQAEEASLAENTLRAPMHELDELEAYGRLIDSAGYAPERIALHFGKPLKDIKKTLALAGVAEEIRQACRDDELDVDDLRGFAVTADTKRQLEVFHGLKKEGRLCGWEISNRMESSGIDSKSDIAKFVGLAAYGKAGGRLEEDLFGEKVTLLDQELLETLQAEKFAKAMEKLGDGWQFTAIDANFQEYQIGHGGWKRKKGNTDSAPEDLLTNVNMLKHAHKTPGNKKALARVQQKLEKHREYSDKEKASSGCILAMNGSAVRVYKGLYTPAAKKSNSVGSAGASGKEDQTTAEAFPQNLKDDLANAKHMVAKISLAESYSFGMDLLTFSAVAHFLSVGHFFGSPLKMEVKDSTPGQITNPEIVESKAFKDLVGLDKGLNRDWFDPHELIESFKKYRLIEYLDKEELLAAVAGYSLSNDSWSHPDGFQDLVLAHTETNIAEYWRPTAENFFGRVKKDLCLKYGVEIFKDPTWAETHKSKSRKQLAAMLGDKVETMSPEECWSPPFTGKEVEKSAEVEA